MVAALPTSEREVFRLSIVDELEALCPELDRDVIHQVSYSISQYCEEVFMSFLLPVEYCGLIISRSLWSVGEISSACRVLDMWCRSSVALVCDPMSRWGVDTKRLWAACSRGIIRRVSGSATGGDGSWIIDINRMDWKPEDLLELAVFECVNVIIEKIAHVWDTHSGLGCLKISGIHCMCNKLYGSGMMAKKKSFVQDVLAFGHMALARQADIRNWKHIPRVINADITI